MKSSEIVFFLLGIAVGSLPWSIYGYSLGYARAQENIAQSCSYTGKFEYNTGFNNFVLSCSVKGTK